MRRPIHVIVAACFCALTVAGCGKSDSAPAAPSTPAAPTVTSLSITGLDALRTTFFTSYTATANMSDGTTQAAATATWTTSNPAVGTVDSTGRVDGLSHGSINLTASYQGRSASKNVAVVNNYGGSWSGTYIIRACDQAGVFAGWCAGLGGVGASLPVSLALTQSGNDRSQMSGTVSLGTIVGNVSGAVTSDGRLNLGGSTTINSGGIVFVLTFLSWDSRLSGAGMTGRWAQSLTANGAPGNAYQENELVTITHTSQQVAVSPAPASYTLSSDELFRMLKQP